MSDTTKTISILSASVGIFIYACFMMSSNIQSLGGGLLRRLFNRISNNKLMCVGIGTAITAIIQSSGATTVMIIGFVNAGMMTLKSAATMIYGANIGTTVTALLVAMGTFSKNVSVPEILAALTFVGVFITTFLKRDKYKKIGGILTGLGLLFTSLVIMNESMSELGNNDLVKGFFTRTQNPLILLGIGVGVTAITQSSSAITVIIIGMLSNNLIGLQQGIYLAIGSNIGSCMPAIIAGWTAGEKNAKRAALIHLLFNMTGALLFGILIYAIGKSSIDIFSYDSLTGVQLAVFHTTFNVITTAFVLPLTNKMVHIVTKIIPDSPEKIENFGDVSCINDHMLKTPSIAVQQVRNQFINMARVAEENFNISCDLLCGKDLIELERFRDNEEKLNNLSKGVMHYIVRLSSMNLSARDLLYISTVHYSMADLRHVSDYADNILEYAERFVNSGNQLSLYAVADIEKMKCLIHDLYEKVMSCYRQLDMDTLKEALDIEDQINIGTDMMIDNHIKRLNSGLCTAGAGAEYLFLISDIKKIAGHFMDVGKTLTRSCQK